MISLLIQRVRQPRALTVFISVAIVYVATACYAGLQSKDTFSTAVAAWALGAHHTVRLGFIPLVKSSPSSLWIVQGAHGSLVTDRFPGAILLAAPIYFIIGGAFSVVPATIVTALSAAGVVAVLYKLVLRLQPAKIALPAALLFAFGTSNWTVSSRELWEHGGAELMIALGMLAFFSRRWVWSGLAFGATVLFRPHLGLGVLVMLIGVVFLERNWRPAASFLVAAVPGVAAYLTWNLVVFGHFTVVGGYQGVEAGGVGVSGFFDNVTGTLLSPSRGLLLCSPFLVLAALGCRQAWRESNGTVRICSLAGLAYLASQLWLIRYSGGSGFVGYRTCLETVVWCGPLLVQATTIGIRRMGGTIAWTLVAVSVAFYASTAFISSEVLGTWNPWTTWSPVILANQYGSTRVVLGCSLGLAGVLAAWAVLHVRRQVADSSLDREMLLPTVLDLNSLSRPVHAESQSVASPG